MAAVPEGNLSHGMDDRLVQNSQPEDSHVDLFTGDLLLFRSSSADHWFLRFYDDVVRWFDSPHQTVPWTHACVLVRNPVLPCGTVCSGIFAVTGVGSERNLLTPLGTLLSGLTFQEAQVRRLSHNAASKSITESKITAFLESVAIPNSHYSDVLRSSIASITGNQPSLPSSTVGLFLREMGIVSLEWDPARCRVEHLTSDSIHPIPWLDQDCYGVESPLCHVGSESK